MSRALQYCGTERRRQRVAQADIDTGGGVKLNGIDYLEVIDREAAVPELRQRQIVLAFLRDDGVLAGGAPLLVPGQLWITGGSRITGIRVTDIEAGPAPHSLLLTLNSAGDYSTYRLGVRIGADNETVPRFLDPMLAALDFSFKAECPSPFDCAAPEPLAAPRDFGPPIDYLAKDYDSFRQLMLDRMAVTLPDWTERSPADLGVTLVEALSHAADQASWFQDAVGTEAFMGRARLRQSVLRHARLLGYAASEGCNARAAVAITAALDRETAAPAAPILPRGSRMLTRPPRQVLPLPAVQPRVPEVIEDLIGAGSIVFETLEDLRSLKVSRNRMLLHDWGDAACCLPVGATSAFLVGTKAGLGLAAGDLVILEERIPFGGTALDPPDPAHRQIVRLTSDPVADRDAVMGVDLVRIDWHADDALRFPLNLESDGLSPGAVAIGNIVLVDEGRTLDHGAAPGENPEDAIARGARSGLLPDDGPGTLMHFRLETSGLVHAAPHDPATAATRSARAAMAPADPPQAAVTLRGAGETWRAEPDLLSADPFLAAFVVETTDTAHYVRFGDGSAGRIPGDIAAMTARIRHGGGRRGNVGADAIALVLTDDADAIAGLRNPLPATGGRDREPVKAIRIAAPHAFRQQRRAVTPADYVAAAELFGDVQRAYAERRWTGSWSTIFLAIDRAGGAPVDAAFEDALRAHLATYRLAGHDLEVVPPRYASLEIRLYVCVCGDHYPGDVERELLSVFSSGYSADGRAGYFHPDNFSFGGNVMLGPIIARAMQVAGVKWIGPRDAEGAAIGFFGRLDQPGIDYADDAEIPIAPNEVARLANNPTFPDHGRIAFIMAGGR